MVNTAVSQVWRPSGARTVILDAPPQLPRGVLPSDLPPLVWPAKDPGDVLDYAIDATSLLAGDTSDRIATVSVTVAPNAGPSDLRPGRAIGDGNIAVLWFSSGQPGTTYSVQVQVGTLNGRVFGRTVLLPVQALATQAPPSGTLTTEAGTVVTDQNGNPILVGG
jgi:hypothetical protein